ncbi:unnamed protein product [Rotaria magnacalcarata]|uniref:Uncharacterized protein n=1 Tax=Rotaria magnacalcarata TaxID=392030 RepID=A0A815ZQW9_9BILA|nr:unnamed protein product [Rotaria magnacalcarata]CAF1586349.1 unnamed protein product [Rotaria magnacalcarata]CAF1899737.1 unnamed protein product [Rotaria magnacalcarata]
MCVAVGDFNNDTCLNVVVANYDNNTVSVLLGYGNGSFRSQVTYSIGDKPLDITVGDFNNNTRPGVMIVNNEERTVSVLLRYDRVMKNEITFAPSVGAHWRSVAVFDFNKDDLVDVVVANDGANSIGVLLGYGNGNFEMQMIFSTCLKSHHYPIGYGVSRSRSVPENGNAMNVLVLRNGNAN